MQTQQNNLIISNNYLLLSKLYAEQQIEQNLLKSIKEAKLLKDLQVCELSDNDLTTFYYTLLQLKEQLENLKYRNTESFKNEINELTKIIDTILLKIEIETDSRQANDSINDYLNKNPEIEQKIKEIEQTKNKK